MLLAAATVTLGLGALLLHNGRYFWNGDTPAAYYGWWYHLGDLVRAEIGVGPQEWRRLARFERSHALVRAGRPLVEVAATCGYADQSHLTREWVALAGCSPTAWRRRELLPSVQDDGPPDP